MTTPADSAARKFDLLSAEAYLRSQAASRHWPRLEEIADLIAADRDSIVDGSIWPYVVYVVTALALVALVNWLWPSW